MQILKSKTSSSKASKFLESIGRNSVNTNKGYSVGLKHFDTFLSKYELNLENVIPSLIDGKIDTYELLDQFIAYLALQKSIISNSTLKFYVAAIRSYLEFYDVDVSYSKFKRRVKMPRIHKDEEQPADLEDIRSLLRYCDNTRLSVYILLLVSSGLRAMEAASLRKQDVNFSVSPTQIRVRPEYSKTKRSRIVYCSDEATEQLQKLLKFRHSDSDLIFALREDTKSPRAIYVKLLQKFNQVQIKADRDERKENSRRHKITFHSFRRTCYSIISENVSSDYANWFLGHDHSVYWTWKESERRKIYETKCMPSLIVADYRALDTRSKNIEGAIKEKDQEIALLKKEMRNMRDEWHALLSEPEKFMEMLQ